MLSWPTRNQPRGEKAAEKSCRPRVLPPDYMVSRAGVVMSLAEPDLMKQLCAHHPSTHSLQLPRAFSLSLQLWLGPRCTTPSARTAQPQPDRGDLPASKHSGLSHEDGASKQSSGVSPQGQTPRFYPVSAVWWMLASRMCRSQREPCSWLQVEPGLGDKGQGHKGGLYENTCSGPSEVG